MPWSDVIFRNVLVESLNGVQNWRHIRDQNRPVFQTDLSDECYDVGNASRVTFAEDPPAPLEFMASSCKVGDFGQRQSSLCFIPYVEWDYVHFDSYHVLVVSVRPDRPAAW